MIPPYGGTLVNLIVPNTRAEAMKANAKDLASLTLDDRALCDLEQLAQGGYSPLRGFMGQADAQRVRAESRLADGTYWPLPITLPVTPGEGIAEGKTIALRDVYGNLLAFLHITEIFSNDGNAETTPNHCAAGRLEVLRIPPHFDFAGLRRIPAALRAHLASLGWPRIAAYPTASPLHRADEAMLRHAAETLGAGLLIQPLVGVTKPGDVDHYATIRSIRAVVEDHFPADSTLLNLLPFAPRRESPRALALRAILARNHGATDLLVSPSTSLELPPEALDAIGVNLIPLAPFAYLPEEDRYAPTAEIPPGTPTLTLSGAALRDDYLSKGVPVPDWFTCPEVAAILQDAHPPRARQGLTIWFTGLSGSGKSTVAHALVERLAEFGRNCSLLDGDEIRTHLSKGLSFSKEDRDTNIRRVGYVAGLVAQHGGTTLCSVISPYRATRDEARQMSKGNFVEVFCDTPIHVCEQRDVKGFYARARAAVAEGNPQGFTGVDDPYEPPQNPEVTLNTSTQPVSECVEAIIARLRDLGYIHPPSHRDG